MTETVAETRIFGQIPDSSDNLYRLKTIGKTRKSLTMIQCKANNCQFVSIIQITLKTMLRILVCLKMRKH